MGKEETARYEHFLLFPQCFQKLLVVYALKRVSMEYRVKVLSLNSASCKLRQYSYRMCGPMKMAKVDPCILGSNLGPYD